MSKKPPKYQQLGLTKSGQGYRTKTGQYISERQYRKMVGTPVKGSQGYKERKEAKARGEDFRATPKALKEYAKTRGANLKDYRSGNKDYSLPPTVKQNQKDFNAAIFEQRRGAIELKLSQGIITEKEAARLMEEFREEAYTLQQLQRITEMLDRNAYSSRGKPLTNEQRRKLENEYRRLTKRYNKAHAKLEKRGIIPPNGSDLENGHYH